jgi:hypothetical protein
VNHELLLLILPSALVLLGHWYRYGNHLLLLWRWWRSALLLLTTTDWHNDILWLALLLNRLLLLGQGLTTLWLISLAARRITHFLVLFFFVKAVVFFLIGRRFYKDFSLTL